MAAMGMLWLMWPGPEGDPKFDARVFQPAYAGHQSKPLVLIDEAHSNLDTASGRYRPFAELLRNDGCTVTVNRRKFEAPAFEGARVVVIANAFAAMPRLLQALGLEHIVPWPVNAFDDEENSAVRSWVGGGGSLLLIAGGAPSAEAAQTLAAQFGIEIAGGLKAGNPGSLRFSRDNGLLLEHAIIHGRGDDEEIHQVLTFGGQVLRGPPGSTAFLKLAEQGAQGVALEFGAGRIVMLADDQMLTSLVQHTGNQVVHLGMSSKGCDNRQLALNVIHWLTRIL